MRPDAFRTLLLALGLGLAGCLMGTSTETINHGPGSGTVTLSDGRPAAGASLVLRSRKVIHAPQGGPAWQILRATTADAKGRFDLGAFPAAEMYLEVREAADSGSADTAAPFQEAYFARIDSGASALPARGALVLAPAGALAGRIASSSGRPLEGHWIGVEGSSVIARLGAREGDAYPFRLFGLAPGQHPLLLVPGSDVAITKVLSADPPRATVKSDAVTDLGAIFYNDTSPAPGPR